MYSVISHQDGFYLGFCDFTSLDDARAFASDVISFDPMVTVEIHDDDDRVIT